MATASAYWRMWATAAAPVVSRRAPVRAPVSVRRVVLCFTVTRKTQQGAYTLDGVSDGVASRSNVTDDLCGHAGNVPTMERYDTIERTVNGSIGPSWWSGGAGRQAMALESSSNVTDDLCGMQVTYRRWNARIRSNV